MIPRLHLVTDDEILSREEFPFQARRAMAEGGSRVALHLRGPGTMGRAIHLLASTLRVPARDHGCFLLVNDRVDVALTLELAGAHLGQRSLPPSIARRLLGEEAVLGLSVHSREEAMKDGEEGLDYLMVGTIFPSSSHPGVPAGGPGLLEEVGTGSSLPLLAIGGITPDRIGRVLEVGAHGVAVRGGVWNREDPGQAVREYLRELERGERA